MAPSLSGIARNTLRPAARDFLLDHHVPGRRPRDGSVPAMRVAMFHAGRCGSTVLGEMLGAQGEVFWAGEIFEGMTDRYRALARHPQAVDRILRRSMAEPFSLRALVRPGQYPNHYRVYGFETKYRSEQHLRPGWIGQELPAYLARLEALGFDRFIVLHRHHHLRKLVSGIAGFRSGVWHTRTGTAGPVPVDLPVHDFRFGPWRGTLVECLRDLDAQYACLLAALAGRRVLHLNYEEHISADPAVAYRAVCAFLDLPAPLVGASLKKTNPFPLDRSVSNWDEVVGALAGTEYAWMLTRETPPGDAAAA